LATTHHPITVPPGRRQVGLDAPAKLPALHLVDGRWIASCPDWGCELAEGWRQDRVERKAARRSCPVCAEVA
jgi:hypothetical protein